MADWDFYLCKIISKFKNTFLKYYFLNLRFDNYLSNSGFILNTRENRKAVVRPKAITPFIACVWLNKINSGFIIRPELPKVVKAPREYVIAEKKFEKACNLR